MNAYFDSLVYMMIMMVVLFMFSFPAMYIYSNYNALRNEAMYTFTKFSLGNLGKLYFWVTISRRFFYYLLICSDRFRLFAIGMQVWSIAHRSQQIWNYSRISAISKSLHEWQKFIEMLPSFERERCVRSPQVNVWWLGKMCPQCHPDQKYLHDERGHQQLDSGERLFGGIGFLHLNSLYTWWRRPDW